MDFAAVFIMCRFGCRMSTIRCSCCWHRRLSALATTRIVFVQRDRDEARITASQVTTILRNEKKTIMKEQRAQLPFPFQFPFVENGMFASRSLIFVQLQATFDADIGKRVGRIAQFQKCPTDLMPSSVIRCFR